MTSAPRVTVFGGTGFLGRRAVRHLGAAGFMVRAATRHPENARDLFADAGRQIESVFADINDAHSSSEALAGSIAAVNAVSLYVEHGAMTFRAVHVDAAARLARAARERGITRLVHVSGVGADPRSSSSYISSRGEGEIAVRDAFPAAVVIRPTVMFGPDDAFLVPLANLLMRTPALPLFGRGRTRLQPAYVEDAGAAIARIVQEPQPAPVYELGGAQIVTYRELLQHMAQTLGRHVVLFPWPFPLWRFTAALAERLPHPPITRNQVQLMQFDNVASPDLPGFGALGVLAAAVTEVLPRILSVRHDAPRR